MKKIILVGILILIICLIFFLFNRKNETKFIWSITVNDTNLLIEEGKIISKAYFNHNYIDNNQSLRYQDYFNNLKEDNLHLNFYNVDDKFAKEVVDKINNQNITYELKKNVNLDLQKIIFFYIPISNDYSSKFLTLEPLILHEIINTYFKGDILSLIKLVKDNTKLNLDYLLLVNTDINISSLDILITEIKIIIINLKNNNNLQLEEYYLKVLERILNIFEKTNVDKNIIDDLFLLVNNYNYQFEYVSEEKYISIMNRITYYYSNMTYKNDIIPRLSSNYTNNYLEKIENALYLLNVIKNNNYLRFEDQIEVGIMNQISGVSDYLDILNDQRIDYKETCIEIIDSIFILKEKKFINIDLNNLLETFFIKLNNCVK